MCLCNSYIAKTYNKMLSLVIHVSIKVGTVAEKNKARTSKSLTIARYTVYSNMIEMTCFFCFFLLNENINYIRLS